MPEPSGANPFLEREAIIGGGGGEDGGHGYIPRLLGRPRPEHLVSL